jgi:hypothetical protein
MFADRSRAVLDVKIVRLLPPTKSTNPILRRFTHAHNFDRHPSPRLRTTRTRKRASALLAEVSHAGVFSVCIVSSKHFKSDDRMQRTPWKIVRWSWT